MFKKYFSKLTRTETDAQQVNPDSMYLLIGLGNPGRDYRTNRHNAGFMLADYLSERLQLRLSRVQSRAIIGTGMLNGKKVLIAKPQTFMNLSGEAAASLLKFYKITLSNLLVLHDDVDMPFGTIRLRAFGSSGGQKGLASVIDKLCTQEFPRLRIGIGRPPGRVQVADYVLQDFTQDEMEAMPIILSKAADAATVFIEHGIQVAMNDFNGQVEYD